MDEDTLIEVEHVDAGYGHTPLLQDVSFGVRRGETFVVLGGSGCGKSTLLKHMIGLVPPLAGEIRIAGDRIAGGSEAERARALRAGFAGVRLGPRVLRTETAPLAALAAIQALWGDLR